MPPSNDEIQTQELGPYRNGSESAAAVKPLNATNSSSPAHTANGKSSDQNGLELLDMSPGQSAPLDVEATTVHSKVRIVAIMGALFATTCIVAMNSTIVATAIPTISSQFKSASGYAWIGGAYLLANAASGPVWAKLSDIWGRKPILLSAVGSFFFSSILCALSTSMKMLLIGRAFQGTAGGGLLQLVNITISDLFSMRERSLYLSLTNLIWAFAGALGPLLGGLFTQHLTWRYIFWINLPIAGVAIVLLFFFLDVHNPRTAFMVGIKAVDWLGIVTIVGLMVTLLLGLEFGGTAFPWDSSTVIGLLLGGVCLGGCFLWCEARIARHPLIPIGLFRSWSNVACLLVAFSHDFVYVATGYYFPLFFQSVLLASPVRSGVLVLPFIVMGSITGIICGIIVHRTGLYLPLIHTGTVLLVTGTSLLTRLSATSPVSSIIGFEIISGVGAGLLFTPPLLALQAHVKQENTATATSTMGFARNLSTCLSVVLGGVIFQNGMEDHAQEFSGAGLDRNITQLLTGENAAANVMLIGMIKDPATQMVVKQAYAESIRSIWIMCAVIAGCGVLCAGLVRTTVLSKVHLETRTGVLEDPKTK